LVHLRRAAAERANACYLDGDLNSHECRENAVSERVRRRAKDH
jgi:hypothetical protein